MKVTCPYCGKDAELKDSSIIYGFSYGMIWICIPCDAYVGVHKNSKKCVPLGRLANKELREWKIKAHKVFDATWKSNPNCTRDYAYKGLSYELNINLEDCHIGMFDIDMCKKVIEACK